MTNTKIAVVAVAISLTAMVHPAHAQFFPQMGGSGAAGNIEGFTVTGKGFVSAKPNRLEIDLEVSAASELSADAIVKYRDAKRKLHEAFAALKLNNVAVEERGLVVDQKGAEASPYFFDYQPNRKAKVEVQLTRKLIVKCSEIRKLDEEALLQLVAKLLDVAQDAGGRVGPTQNPWANYYWGMRNQQSGLVRFILDDYDKLEEEAYAKAVADAEARAGRLAKLSHVKLGSITAVRELFTPGPRETGQEDDAPPQNQKRLESSRFQEIPVRVELMVRFEAAAVAGANGKVGVR
jgi:uncharacterized protein YggE